MRFLIKKLLKENFEVISDISMLSADVLKVAIKNFVILAIKQRSSLNVFSSIFNVFDKLNYSYAKINDFLKDFKLTIKFTRTLGDKTSGQFKPYTDNEGLLILRLSPQEVSKLLEKYVLNNLSQPITEQLINSMVDNIYNDIITEVERDTVAHELQHAYDSWISKRKYTASKASIKYRADYPDENTPITDKQYYDYLRLPHEVNARFTETVRKLKLIVKKDDGSFDMVDFEKVKKEFEDNFEGFNLIQPKMAKRLIKRLYAYYLSVKEKILNI